MTIIFNLSPKHFKSSAFTTFTTRLVVKEDDNGKFVPEIATHTYIRSLQLIQYANYINIVIQPNFTAKRIIS